MCLHHVSDLLCSKFGRVVLLGISTLQLISAVKGDVNILTLLSVACRENVDPFVNVYYTTKITTSARMPSGFEKLVSQRLNNHFTTRKKLFIQF